MITTASWLLTSPVDSQRAALRFLEAYWRADLESALAVCTPDAAIELPSSTAIASPAPIATVLPMIFTKVYPRFVQGHFEIQIDRVMSEEAATVVEYTATGSLVNGRLFHCRYLVMIEVEGGKVNRFRPYTDTKYIDAELLAGDRLC